MTKVNFYQVAGTVQPALDLSCELAEKAQLANMDALIYCPDRALMAQLCDRLWSWSAASFLPYRVDHEGPERIRLCQNEEPGDDHGVLINLAAHTPDWFGRFETLCELIYGDQSFVDSKRQRYKFYKDRGFPLSYHDLSDRQQQPRPADD